MSIVIVACGGGGAPVSSDSTFTIRWGERTRGPANAPSSALSARVTFPAGGTGGADLVCRVDRSSAPGAYTGTYHVGSVIPTNVNNFEIEFFSEPGQAGGVVATATADISWQGNRANLNNVVTDGTVASVEVIHPGNVSEVDPKLELEFLAKDSEGASLALTPGSGQWALLSGGSSMTVSRDGTATPLLPGSVSVRVAVDGVSSSPLTINISRIEISAKHFSSETSSTLFLGGDASVQGGEFGELPSMWRGTDESQVDLTPAGASSGRVLAANSDVQVGHVYTAASQYERAALWTGSSASFVDLTPTSPRVALGGSATCTANDRQGGFAIFAHPQTFLVVFQVPGYWSGTASSWISLLPTAFSNGKVFGISATHECGMVLDGSGNGERAAFWSGTASSFKSLHPASASKSVALALNGEYQVGYVKFGSVPRAYAWRGTAGSAVDLQGSLGLSSEARAVVDHFAAGSIDNVGAIWNIQTGKLVKLDSHLPSGFTQSGIYGGAKTSSGYDFVGYVSNPVSGATMGTIWHVPNRRMPQ